MRLVSHVAVGPNEISSQVSLDIRSCPVCMYVCLSHTHTFRVASLCGIRTSTSPIDHHRNATHPTGRSVHTREFPQIENTDVGVNADVESHPVGHSTPQILLVASYSKQNSALICKFQKKVLSQKERKHAWQRKQKHFAALDFHLLSCSGPHRVIFYS